MPYSAGKRVIVATGGSGNLFESQSGTQPRVWTTSEASVLPWENAHQATGAAVSLEFFSVPPGDNDTDDADPTEPTASVQNFPSESEEAEVIFIW